MNRPEDPHEVIGCLLCGGRDLVLCYDDPEAPAVTSDIKLQPASWKIYGCRRCGHLQKKRTSEFDKAVRRIYADYHLFDLSNTSDQRLFHEGRAAETRSGKIFERLSLLWKIPGAGKMLDIGCGNGAMLAAFSGRVRNWKIYGYEPDESRGERILALPGIEGFFSGELEGIREKFDLITLSHVFEHIDEPAGFLSAARKLLAPGGLLLIQVPNLRENAFDFVVADHYSHFTPEVLSRYVSGQGFEIKFSVTDCVPKEITLGAVCSENQNPDENWYAGLDAGALTENGRQIGGWLQSVAEQARAEADRGRTGVFGTAIAGTWLAGVLGERAEFFVDEDPDRIGKYHLEKPVQAPGDVNSGESVFVALPPQIAAGIAARLTKTSKARWICPVPATAGAGRR
ncbi:MAG: hypothetical protein A2Z83_07615 [Omnitrophica bacterium GWA2_52_8]|nr:MAG: hypothetical protein A2Z83_07615 [Omnitrophica bacterium GWA2_52_8]